MPESRLVDRNHMAVRETGRLSPMDRLISDLDGTYYKMSEVAEIVGTSMSTLRRLLKQEGVTAPSKVYERGNAFIYLYTPEDVEEIRDVLILRTSER